MPIVRTPEERFSNLPDFPYAPHYIEIRGRRVHYVDQGAGLVVLCLHGEPTWSYLYRKVIATLAPKYRVVAPDFIGFGRSDKFTGQSEYSYRLHVDTLVDFIEQVDIRDITIVVQDWGGLIGLRVASLIPERFARLVIMNTALPTGKKGASGFFYLWRAFARYSPVLPVGRIVNFGTVKGISSEERAAYDAPFPEKKYKAGARAWPLMVPIRPDDPVAAEMKAAREALSRWTRPALVMFSDKDYINRGIGAFFTRLIPGAKDHPEIIIRNAGHFIQEDAGAEISNHIAEFITRTPLK